MRDVFEFGPFTLDPERLLLLHGGEPVALGPKVVETLVALVEHPGDVLTKQTLLDRIWPEGYVNEASLVQNVYTLRKVLAAHWDAKAIETIPRRGYRFVAPVRRTQAAPPSQAPPVVATGTRRSWLPAAAAILAVLVLAGGIAFGVEGSRSGVQRAALSPEGARLYDIGRYYWNLRTRDGVVKSVKYFERVVATDPHDARGYAALASADVILGDYEYGPEPPRVSIARARRYAHKALALDADCGEAYAVLGMIASEKRADSDEDLPRAVIDFQRAIALDPSSGPAHEWYGIALVEQGRIDAAYQQLRKAADLDPLSVATTAWLGNVAYLERRYGDAIAYARETLDLSPVRYDAYETLGLSYEARGDRNRAIEAFEQLAGSCTPCRAEGAALLAGVYARTNQIARARAQLAIARRHPADVTPEDLAAAFAAVGERRVALSWLLRSHSQYLRAEIDNDPRFAGLRPAGS